ncbi:MAG: DUF1761 domain-containing protein [Tenuifilaceae bacterium]
MCILTSFAEINWLSVIVAALAAFAIGGLWYSPVLFGDIWAKELKLSDDDLKKANMPLIFGTTFVLNIIAAMVLDIFIGLQATLISGLMYGLIVAVAWVSTSLGINYLFSRKSLKLFFIDAGYFLVFFPIMGAILGVW